MKSLILIYLFGIIYVNGQYRSFQRQNDRIPILRNDYLNDGHGNYEYSYETSNGISANEHASQHTIDDKIVRGSYSYIGDDGKTYTVNYYADATGFHPMGDHIPTGLGTGSTHYGNNGYNKKQTYYKPQKIQPQLSGYQKPKVGYNYQPPTVQYIPPAPVKNYLPPAPASNYLPPHYRY